MKKVFTSLCIFIGLCAFNVTYACITIEEISSTSISGGCFLEFEVRDTTGSPNGISCLSITVIGPNPDEPVIMEFNISEPKLPDTVEFFVPNILCEDIIDIIAEAWTSFPCGTGQTCAVPLPAELTSWGGKALERANELNWSTASENNTMAFVIERSGNGRTNWQEVGRVNAAGFTNAEQSYTFMDDAPLFVSYYRLRTVDFDGYYEYSDLIIVERDRKLLADVLVAPNPVQEDWTRVSFISTVERDARILLSDLTGTTHFERKLAMHKGLNVFDLDFEGFAKGIYFMRIEMADGVVGKKIVVTSKE